MDSICGASARARNVVFRPPPSQLTMTVSPTRLTSSCGGGSEQNGSSRAACSHPAAASPGRAVLQGRRRHEVADPVFLPKRIERRATRSHAAL